MTKAMVFGVFDGLHEGHRYFLSQAAGQCDALTVVLTLDEIVWQLKGQLPVRNFDTRRTDIVSFNPHFTVVAGDARLGEWKVLHDHEPDRIFLGYDQQGIAAELEKFTVLYEILEAHYPERYKSSLL